MNYRFDAWEVDAVRGRLLRGDEVIPLTGKAFEALLALIEARGEVVEKEALMRRLWPDTTVEEGNLTQQISTLRKALGESPHDHRYVVTVARRGYRFVAPVAKGVRSPAGAGSVTVGRTSEMAALERAFADVRTGRGLLMCVAGEAGIGKSTLVAQFLDRIEDRAVVLRGRCSERLTSGEAHLPVLEALEQFLRGGAGPAVTQMLLRRAPSWYAQVAPLAGAQETARPASQERQKRELAGFLEELSTRSPVVLWLDDIHWADPSTLDLLIHLTTRSESMPILLIANYRPAELLLGQEPFSQSLREHLARGRARELAVRFLTAEDVEQYLALEFAEHEFPAELAGLLHRRTRGNPLFLTDLVRDLRDRGAIARKDQRWAVTVPLTDVAQDIPASVRNLLDRTIDRIEPVDRQILAAGSVQGAEFDSAVVARALGLEPAVVEERLARLARVHNVICALPAHEHALQVANERYAFVHVLHQEALNGTLVPSRRIGVSGAVADALRNLGDGHRPRIAHQLALLYGDARRPLEAIDHFVIAAQHAVSVSAPREAAALARQGLDLVAALPPSPEVASRELHLLIVLGVPLAALVGYANPEVERTYKRALQLSRELDAREALFPCLWGLWVLYHVRADLPRALESAQNALAVAEGSGDRRLLTAANVFLGYTRGHMGELDAALEHCRRAEAMFEPEWHAFYMALSALDPSIASLAQQGRLLALLGERDEALDKAQQAVALARSVRTPNAIGFALVWLAFVHQLRDEPDAVREVTGEALALATEHGLADVQGWAVVLHAWTLPDPQASLGMMRFSLDAQRHFGSEIARPHQLALVADVQARAGDVEGALATLDEALEQAVRTRDVYYEPELHRMKSELLLRAGDAPAAKRSLDTALETARIQGSRLFIEKASSIAT